MAYALVQCGGAFGGVELMIAHMQVMVCGILHSPLFSHCGTERKLS